MKKPKTCKLCNKKFVGTGKKFCSPSCYHQSLRNLDKYRNKICIYCGNHFMSNQHSKKQISLNVYCSKKCRREHQSIKQRTGSYKICLQCQKEFYAKQCNIEYKFCSRTCGYKHNKGKYNVNRSISRAQLIASGKFNPKRNYYKQGWYNGVSQHRKHAARRDG